MNPIFPAAGRPPENSRFGEPKNIQMPSGRQIYLIANPLEDSAKPKGLVLYFHGNGEVVEDLDYVLPFFKKAGLYVILVEYPGYGHAPGNPSEKDLYQTGLSAYDWARKQFPNLPVYAAGWSLGSSVAAHLAMEREVEHLFLLSAMTSMKAVILRLFPGIPEGLLSGNEFETTRFLKKLRAPVTIIHGTEDDLVPFEMGKELKKILGERAHLIPISGAGHNDLYPRGAKQIQEEIFKVVPLTSYSK